MTLLVMLTSVCCWFAWRVHRQQARLEYFEQLGANTRTEPAKPLWLHDLVVATFGEQHATGFTDVTALDLNGSRITNSGPYSLNDPASLPYLSLNDTITDAGLQHLSELSRLRNLSLDHMNFTDGSLQYLSRLNRLERLALNNTQVTDAGLQQLSGPTSLEQLSLTNTQVTDEGLQYLISLSNLKVLSLHGTQVTDAGIQQLSGLTSLEKLYLGNTEVTAAGVEQLRLRFPQHVVILTGAERGSVSAPRRTFDDTFPPTE